MRDRQRGIGPAKHFKTRDGVEVVIVAQQRNLVLHAERGDPEIVETGLDG